MNDAAKWGNLRIVYPRRSRHGASMRFKGPKSRKAKTELGHCSFCDRVLEIMVLASETRLSPFGECRRCRRFTIWQSVDLYDAIAPAPTITTPPRRRDQRAA
jgi:hypothetical protein